MYSNYICNYAWFAPEKYNTDKIVSAVLSYNSLTCPEENYMTVNFSDTYFRRDDCAKIGYIREDIERKYINGEFNLREKALLITSLLYAMDKIANTCGHYDAYRKGAEFEGALELTVPLAGNDNHIGNRCLNADANVIASQIDVDLVYIDPPYNSRQYCDAYHLLENVAKWEKPEVYGVAKKMDRSSLKSKYCTRSAPEAFDKLIGDLHSRYILLSYNNMAQKGNDRSNAKISDSEIMNTLSKKGEVKVFSEDYKAFTTGKSNISDNEERLFLCVCN